MYEHLNFLKYPKNVLQFFFKTNPVFIKKSISQEMLFLMVYLVIQKICTPK